MADRARQPEAQLEPFGARVSHLDGSATVALTGEFDLLDVDDAWTQLRPLTRRYDGSQITFDCSGLEFIDVPALGCLVALAKTAQAGRITLYGPSPILRRVLELTATSAMFEIVPATATGAAARTSSTGRR